MPLGRQRQWRIQNQYQSLNEYNNLKSSCPPGIYLSLTPGNFALWSGVLFVREGPYAPAILRFQVAFPQQYPAVPPLILFASDVFHPLITPLTTYTYSTATPASVTVSSGDDERLLPGGFSLRHGFPKWFDRGSSGLSPRFPSDGSRTENMFKDINSATRPSNQDQDRNQTKLGHQRRPLSFHIPPPKEDAINEDDIAPSMVQVLHYLKRVFEDETLLDALPLDIAANTGAWYAWQAHRRRTSKPLPRIPNQSQTPLSDDRGLLRRGSPARVSGHGRSHSVGIGFTLDSGPGSVPSSPGLSTFSTPIAKQGIQANNPNQTSTPASQEQQQNQQKKKSMADWNWDGVWLERVKKGINTSLSDAVLYGSGEGDDLIHFLDVDDQEYSNFKESIPGRTSGTGGGAVGAVGAVGSEGL